SRLLVFVPLLAALYMFVWPTVARAIFAPDQPLIPNFTNHLVTTDFWATFPALAVAVPFLFICGFMTVYFLGSKGFCTYACPYGGFFAVADKFSPGRIRVTDACNECGHCTATCTSNVIVHEEVRQFGMVVDPGCMKCLDCVSVCPKEALYFGFGKPAGKLARRAGQRAKPGVAWGEELVLAAFFVAAFAIYRGLYGLVPFLLALGLSGVLAFAYAALVRVLRRTSASLLGRTL